MARTTGSTVVEVESREAKGTNAAGRLRAAGSIPANVYGLDLAPYSVAVSARRIGEVLSLGTGQNTMLTLSIAGTDKSRDVMIRELQRDPVTNRVVHVDFVRIDTAKTLEVSVPVQLLGIPEGVKNEAGILDHVHREVLVACLPNAIPEHLDVDVSELHVNQHVSVSDLTVGEGVTLLDDPETIIATVSMSKAEVTTTAEEEEEEAVEGAEAAAESTDKDKDDAGDGAADK